MMLEMNYLQRPEEKQDPERKHLKKAGLVQKKEEVHLQDRAKAASEEFLTNLHSHLFSIK